MNNQGNGKTVFLLALVIGGLGFACYYWVVSPLLAQMDRKDELTKGIEVKQAKVADIAKSQKQLATWRAMSLPGVENYVRKAGQTDLQAVEAANTQAQYLYLDWLRALLKRHGITDADPQKRSIDAKSAPQIAPNTPAYTVVPFTIHLKTRLPNLVGMMKEFEHAPLLHRIRSISVKRVEQNSSSSKVDQDLLNVTLVVESLIVGGATRRGEFLEAAAQPAAVVEAGMLAARHRVSGLGLLPWAQIYAAAVLPKTKENNTVAYRDHSNIIKKNIFDGYLPPTVKPIVDKPVIEDKPKPKPTPPVVVRATPDLISFVYLTDVTMAPPTGPWASLHYILFYDSKGKAGEKVERLQLKGTGSALPLVHSGDGTPVVQAEVMDIATRGVVLRVGLQAFSAAELKKQGAKSAEVIHELAKDDVASLTKAKKIKAEEAARTYKMESTFWDGLQRDKVVRITSKSGQETFAFRSDLVHGQVINKESKWVYIRLDEKYCSYPSRRLEEGTVTQEPLPRHAGYCFLGIGGTLTDALQSPIEERELKQLLAARGP